MIHFSTQLSNALLASGSLKSLIDTGKIYIYSGPVPATADDAIDGSCVLLVTVSNGGTGVTFDGTPANGVLKKTTSETWSETIGTSGTASFYRLCVGSDDGSAASTTGNYRVQGTIGTDASFDLVVPSTTLTSGNTQSIDTYQLYITP